MKKTLFQIAALFIIAVSAAGVSWLVRDKHPKPVPAPVCDPATLKPDEICFEQVPGNVLWVDARSRDEWKKNGFPNSILWNLDPKEDALKMESEAAMKIAEAKLVVVYCSSEKCGTSRQIADRIKKLELGPEVRILFGGYPKHLLK
jgi:rhodanese-related sulfurtransferase